MKCLLVTYSTFVCSLLNPMTSFLQRKYQLKNQHFNFHYRRIFMNIGSSFVFSQNQTFKITILYNEVTFVQIPVYDLINKHPIVVKAVIAFGHVRAFEQLDCLKQWPFFQRSTIVSNFMHSCPKLCNCICLDIRFVYYSHIPYSYLESTR